MRPLSPEEQQIAMMINVHAQYKEERANPAKFDRHKPYNKLPLLSALSLASLELPRFEENIRELAVMASHLEGVVPSASLLEEMLRNEARYSNQIESIANCDDGGLRAAWEVPFSQGFDPAYVTQLSACITPDCIGVRKPNKNRVTRLVYRGTVEYTPPSTRAAINRLLADLLAFEKTCSSLSFWLKAALMHGQYEAIHPLFDGNGRSGRLILNKQLMAGLKTTVPFQLSEAIMDTRSLYYDALNAPRLKNDQVFALDYFIQMFTQALNDTLNQCC